MCESYTVGGDTFNTIDYPAIAGQVFSPRETHTLEYIDLELKGLGGITVPYVYLYPSRILVDPATPPLSWDTTIVGRLASVIAKGRVRFKMKEVVLETPLQYVIVLVYLSPFPGGPLYWLYDKDDANYPRGYRVFSPDAGLTWAAAPNDDFIFAEFGTPPLPQPEPPPPIQNFSTLDIEYHDYENAVCVSVATSVPCHLTCYFTGIQPRVHKETRVFRGQSFPWAPYYCFVASTPLEQIEEGDTMYHSFLITEWYNGWRKWFCFKGLVDESNSPSISPVFSHMNEGTIRQPYRLHPNAPGDDCFIPYETGAPCPNHYQNIDDHAPDEDTTEIWNGEPYNGQYVRDLYKIPIPIDPGLAIGSVTLTARVKRVGGYDYAGQFRFALKKSGVFQWLPIMQNVPDHWQNFSLTLEANPFTSLPWTIADIINMQLGIGLYYYRGIGWNCQTHCTQLYLDINWACPFRP